MLQWLGRRGIFQPGRITYIPVEQISCGEHPRRRFEEIKELADSVARYGVLQPLSVRQEGLGRYVLISGQRRLRAAKLVGLAEVPCVVMEADCRESKVLSLVENLQHRELDFVEQAEGLQSLISDYGMSQEEAARRVGMSQPSAANKLRL
ncbi:MAG: ParB/RepB/Spo0J family partition protein, partial [Oscillospiraceae bacterium]|nr:ParB/RepB/Spo0J family partition protein [Oscillospiraceae bacterium]